MKTRCPCCGAVLSLDALVAHDDARAALARVFKLNGELGAALCRYLAFFRPPARELSMARVARLLGELVPAIVEERIERGGRVYEAPLAAWLHGLGQVQAAAEAGRLKRPLTSHGYLMEVIAGWRPAPGLVCPAAASTPAAPKSYVRAAIDALGERIK